MWLRVSEIKIIKRELYLKPISRMQLLLESGSVLLGVLFICRLRTRAWLCMMDMQIVLDCHPVPNTEYQGVHG